MKLFNSRWTIVRSVLLAVVASGAMGVAGPGTRDNSFGVPSAEAQNFGQRTIEGKVTGEGDGPVSGATVFLKNLKTRDVKSFSSASDGAYRFAQVGMVDDYELWAEAGKKKSAVKTISSFDSRKQLEVQLKLK